MTNFNVYCSSLCVACSGLLSHFLSQRQIVFIVARPKVEFIACIFPGHGDLIFLLRYDWVPVSAFDYFKMIVVLFQVQIK